MIRCDEIINAVGNVSTAVASTMSINLDCYILQYGFIIAYVTIYNCHNLLSLCKA